MKLTNLSLQRAHEIARSTTDEINKLTGGELFKLDCGPRTYELIIEAIEKALPRDCGEEKVVAGIIIPKHPDPDDTKQILQAWKLTLNRHEHKNCDCLKQYAAMQTKEG